MTVYSTDDFEPEFTALSDDFDIEIEKVGGGTVGKRYEGYWHFRVMGTDDVLEMFTGTPKNHAEAADHAADFMRAIRDDA